MNNRNASGKTCGQFTVGNPTNKNQFAHSITSAVAAGKKTLKLNSAKKSK
jgi:hypothetical protein